MTSSTDEVPLVLGDLIRRLDAIDEWLIVYVPENSDCDASTKVYFAEYRWRETSGPPGTKELLRVALMKQVLDVWSKWRGGVKPSLAQACEAIRYYAENDAYLDD